METTLSTNLVASFGVDAFSQAVSMAGANQALFGIQVVSLIGTATVRITIQEGNDLQNWTDVVSSGTLSSLGYTQLQPSSGIASQYVRLKVFVGGTDGDTVVLGLSVDTADL